MRIAFGSLALALLFVLGGIAFTVVGVRVATLRGRPHNLGGMLVAAVGLSVALAAMLRAVGAVAR